MACAGFAPRLLTAFSTWLLTFVTADLSGLFALAAEPTLTWPPAGVWPPVSAAPRGWTGFTVTVLAFGVPAAATVWGAGLVDMAACAAGLVDTATVGPALGSAAALGDAAIAEAVAGVIADAIACAAAIR